MIISVDCRGNMNSNLIRFYQGCAINIENMLNDLTDSI